MRHALAMVLGAAFERGGFLTSLCTDSPPAHTSGQAVWSVEKNKVFGQNDRAIPSSISGIRENGAAVFRVSTDNRQRRIEMDEIRGRQITSATATSARMATAP